MINLVLLTVYLLFIGFHATAINALLKPTNDKLRISALSFACVHFAIWSVLAFGRLRTGFVTIIDLSVWLLAAIADILFLSSSSKPYIESKSAKRLRLAAIAFQGISILVVAGLTILYAQDDFQNVVKNVADRITT